MAIITIIIPINAIVRVATAFIQITHLF
jgi:hypothetical protein